MTESSRVPPLVPPGTKATRISRATQGASFKFARQGCSCLLVPMPHVCIVLGVQIC